ncbi:MAG: aminopeptidase 1 [Candidatus Aminicenantes bacterium]|nr:aminopeptidase 1 [Candidatus Aminicenantes bacterium]
MLMLLFNISAHQGSSASSDRVNAWISLTPQQKQETHNFALDYKEFISLARSELSTVQQVVKLAEAEGFSALKPDSELRAGARYFDINRSRAIALIVVGKKSVVEGLRIIATHIDAPRIELKARPIYSREGYALFQTIYHGGIKNYQWANIPLGLTGRVDQKDGSIIYIDIGFKPDEPAFIIPDLAPHVDRPYRNRTASEVFQGEELDPIVGSISGEKQGVKEMVLDYLKKTYDIEEDDFVSAELSLVPGFPPQDIGFDRGLIGAYGQDDRLCSYIGVRAGLDIDIPTYTSIIYLSDNEESGCNNNTGARSLYLPHLIARLIELQSGGEFKENQLRLAMERSEVLSADTPTGINPLFPSVQEATNAARLGWGVPIKRYGHGNDANSEFTAKIRRLLDENHIPWQTSTYKVDIGGGGTLGFYLSQLGMEVIDVGVPLLSMHSTFSVASKVDIYYLYLTCKAFLMSR